MLGLYSTFAFSEAKLTFAFTTPETLLNAFSIFAAHEAQCIPLIGRIIFSVELLSGFFGLLILCQGLQNTLLSQYYSSCVLYTTPYTFLPEFFLDNKACRFCTESILR